MLTVLLMCPLVVFAFSLSAEDLEEADVVKRMLEVFRRLYDEGVLE